MKKTFPLRREVLLILTLYQQIFTSSTIDAKDETSRDCLLVTSNNRLSASPDPRRPSCKITTRVSPQGNIPLNEATETLTSWFELLGCFMYETFENNPSNLNSTSTVGPIIECSQICRNYSNFGINNNTCICAQGSTHGKISKNCKFSTSEDFKNDVIGTNELINNFLRQGFAMYRKINITEIVGYSQQDGTVCIKVKNQTRDYELVPMPCNEKYFSNCPNQSTKLLPDCSSQTKTRTLLHHTYDSPTTTVQSNDEGTKRASQQTLLWTSEARVLVSTKQSTSTPKYTTLTDKKHQTDGSGTKRASQRTLLWTSKAKALVSTKQSTSTLQYTNLPDMKLQTDDSVLEIIGCVVGIVCIVIIVIVIFIIKKRNEHKRNDSSSNPRESVHYTEITLETGEQQKMKVNLSPSINNPNYDTMSSVNEIEKSKETQKYDHLMLINKTDVYNHAGYKPITEQITDHLYSTTLSGNDANTYDHAVTHK